MPEGGFAGWRRLANEERWIADCCLKGDQILLIYAAMPDSPVAVMNAPAETVTASTWNEDATAEDHANDLKAFVEACHRSETVTPAKSGGETANPRVDQECLRAAIEAVEADSAGHWPTVAGFMYDGYKEALSDLATARAEIEQLRNEKAHWQEGRMDGRAEFLSELIRINPENLDRFIGTSSEGESGEYTEHWKVDELRKAFKCDESKGAYEWMEGLYWDLMAKSSDAEFTERDLKAEIERLRGALQWAMDKDPSPCRCIDFATPPHVCPAHKALSGNGGSRE